MGYDPSNINVAKELIKKKSTEVVALKKQLKLPASEDPMAKINRGDRDSKIRYDECHHRKKLANKTNGGADREIG